jgi:gamma-glutamyltranspeptidase/glutathione hydrolase
LKMSYKGEIAEIIADDFQGNGGFITREDLANYRLVVERPLRAMYRDYQVFSAHPPSSGAQLIQLLNILEQLDLRSMGHLSSRYVHHVARAMQISFADRASFMGDPEFVDVPVERWISKEYAAECRRRLLSREKIVVPKLKPRESGSTTHISVMDGEGNAVSLTHTLGSASGVITPGLGFTYNNCMYQYNPFPGHPNSIEPGKRRITGMAPTIVFRNDRPWMVVGGPGGTRILTVVMHTFINVVEFGLSAFEAVSAPRFQCEGEDIEMESRLYFLVREELEAMGWKLEPSAYALDNGFARAYAIINRGEDRGLEGGADPRAGGCSAILR